jgi:hypothetical protein
MPDTGTMVIDTGEHHRRMPRAVAMVHLYGPRGGHLGSTLIDRHDAETAMRRLSAVASPPATALDSLLNAAEAVAKMSGFTLAQLDDIERLRNVLKQFGRNV